MSAEPLLPQIIETRAGETPDRLFLQQVEGGELTYGALHEEGLIWASALEALGVKAGAQVACMLPNGFDVPRAWLGAAWLKARLALMNPIYRGAMLNDTLTTVQAKVLLVTTRSLEQLATIDLAETNLETLVFLDSETPPRDLPLPAIGRTAFLDGARPAARTGPQPHDTACIIFTSGTSGPSKAVLVPWAQLHSQMTDKTAEELGPDDCWYSPLPMCHLTGIGPIYKMGRVGGRVVIRERLSLRDYFSEIERYGATIAVFIESMLQMIMKGAEGGYSRPPSLSKIITVPVPGYIDEFKRIFGVRIATMYNMSELGLPITSNGFDVDETYAGSCGRLRADVYEAAIVDSFDYPLPDGEMGELVLRPRTPWTITPGYLNNTAATAEAWGNGWFHTGDAFRRAENGLYYFIDRMKDAIRRRGENISSAEVEREVLAHPSVREVAAVPQLSDQGQEEVKVFIVPKDATDFDPAAIANFLAPRMPHFMVPRYFEAIDALPRNTNEKVQKHLLRAMGNGAGAWDREAAGMKLQAPR